MNVVFRVDASVQIGTGHVMRCLTLAEELREQGHQCRFICRAHEGHLGEFIKFRGFELCLLEQPGTATPNDATHITAYAVWLGISWQQDAEQTTNRLAGSRTDWLVVDHYALDSRWEWALKPCYERLMVIDDLADRSHQCDLLLDQTFGRQAEDYAPWVPAVCKVLCGAHYALLRPEFAEWRSYSLQRRLSPKLKHILVTMGGVDKDNATGCILEALDRTDLPAGCQITVVMGATAPWLDTVRQQAATISYPTTVLAGVSNMARLMADSDLAIGAAGATSWERCCLGLPTIMIILAENQRGIGNALAQSGAAFLVAKDEIAKGLVQSLKKFVNTDTELRMQSNNARVICDGEGTRRLVPEMNRISN